ncbi:MAG: PQQ-dependent sugar dehydrogenase [Pseudomonadota bacterium]
MIRTLAALTLIGSLTACGSASSTPPPEQATQADLTLTEIADGLAFPWGIAVLPNGDMLVTERDGQMRIVRDGILDETPIEGLPDDMLILRQGGLLDVELHPDFVSNRLVYFTYAEGTEDENLTVVARGALKENGTALVDVEDIFKSNVPGKNRGFHFGSRLVWLDDGSLLVGLGDGGGFRHEAQNTENQFGTIVRMTEDGGVPAGNPFDGQEGADPYVYTYGNRNVQGMVYDVERDRIYAHEHGPKGGDELNVIEAGTNYGWPVITYGENYDGSVISDETEADGMAQPAVKWVPSIAPSGMVVYRGDVYPGWDGDLLIGAMNGPEGQKLVRVDLDEAGDVVGVEDLFDGEGIPFRDVEVGIDGHVYLATAELDGRLFRLDVAQ